MHLDLRGTHANAAYKLLTNIVIPRPIAWVCSMDLQGGINLAPFSFFNLVGANPALVVLGIGNDRHGKPKHTAENIALTGEFVVNLVTEDLAHAMNLTAADFPRGESELDAAGLTAAPSTVIKCPRVAEAGASLECTLHKIEQIGANNLIIGEIVALHIRDELIDERLHVHAFYPIARIGGPAGYSRTTDRFELPRPTTPPSDSRPRETRGDN
jgi:flavin reductase (DIM6/NTAB) family NADH-FMN oxidoreductase RutF